MARPPRPPPPGTPAQISQTPHGHGAGQVSASASVASDSHGNPSAPGPPTISQLEEAVAFDGKIELFDVVDGTRDPFPWGRMTKEINVQLEKIFKQILDERWGAGKWTLTDIKRRCVLQRNVSNPVETMWVDGVPVLEMHPIETKNRVTEIGWIITATLRYRRL